MPKMTAAKEQVLIVDDDHTFTAVLARAFNKRGYATQTAHCTAQAIRIIENHHFQKAVLDLKIGHESGLTLIPKIKAHNKTAEIIVLTGYSSIATSVHAIKLGATNYLCKPADADEILAALESNNADPNIQPATNPISVDRLEWEHIQNMLQTHDGNISATARSLGMHRRTLQRKLLKKPVKK